MYSEDYTLVKRVKAADREASLLLFNKFKRLVHLRARSTISPADFEQEAFELMIKAINKVNLERVRDPASWGFYFGFSMELLKGLHRHNVRELRSCYKRPRVPVEFYTGDRSFPGLDASPSGMEDEHRSLKTVNGELTRYTPERELTVRGSTRIYASLVAGCSPIEKRLLELKADGYKISDCARLMRIDYLDARKMLRALKDRAQQLIDRSMR